MQHIKTILLKDIFDCYIFKINFANDNVLDKISSLIKDKKAIIQISQGNITTKEFYDLALKIRQLCAIFDSLLIIKDRIDVALLSDASGVFIDKDSFDINKIKSLINNDMIIGSNIPTIDCDYYISEYEKSNKLTYILNSNIATYKAHLGGKNGDIV